MTIEELLDEYAKANRTYGAATESVDGAQDSFEWDMVEITRADVDAKIKEMQDRIAELEATLDAECKRYERELAYVRNSPAF